MILGDGGGGIESVMVSEDCYSDVSNIASFPAQEVDALGFEPATAGL